MDNQKIKQLLVSFGLKEKIKSWKSFGHGHINDTFLIQTAGINTPDYILQRKNHLVFRDVPGMMDNIIPVTDHIRKKLLAAGETEIDRKVMKYLSTPEDKHYVQDDAGNFWTLFLFVSDSHGIEEVTNPDQAYSAGKAFGRFQLLLSDLDGGELIETIPSFHNGKYRFHQFTDAVMFNKAGRRDEMKMVIDMLHGRKEEMLQLQLGLDNGKLPVRITHNDTKINNILFDKDDNILCIIDLDTVMPGTTLFDFGDAIRTLGNSAVEDEPDVTKISFRSEYFEAYTMGYLSESRNFLTDTETDNLVYACRYMVWEQAIRFLTDYLNGDTYYKISYPEHNKVRTLSQLRYLEVLEENAAAMKKIVKENL